MIFGASGAGKSTFLKMLQGLYNPVKGDILLGDINLCQFDPKILSQHILLMPQEPYIFYGSFFENITYGSSTTENQFIDEAVRLARVDEFVNSLPNSLNSPVGDDGGLLSGGQRQRVALARVLSKNPKVLILDEPTSALDRHLEIEVINNLFSLCEKGTTIVMSTHKVDLAPLADHLLWFDNNTINSGKFEDFEHKLSQLKVSRKPLTKKQKFDSSVA
jgi:ABC-type bacteriocin/lantibiotic exporter with double-glycine peptidase domain